MTDNLTRHQLLLQRHFKSIYKEAVPILKALKKDIQARLLTANSNEFDRLTLLLAEINTAIASATSDIQNKISQPLLNLYDYESQYSINLLDGFTKAGVVILGTGLTAEIVKSSLSVTPMKLGDEIITIDEMFTQFSSRISTDVATKVRTGLIAGDTTKTIVYDVAKMVETRSYSQLEAVILTAANHIGTIARDEVWKQNAHLLDGEEFVATLDSRTTIRCASLDGKIFPIGVGPRPPLHYRCRSIRVPVVKKEYRIPMKSERSSQFGVVSGDTTYESWLRRQSIPFQNEVLGIEKAKMFRSGDFKLGDFVDNSGKEYTLEQLKSFNF